MMHSVYTRRQSGQQNQGDPRDDRLFDPSRQRDAAQLHRACGHAERHRRTNHAVHLSHLLRDAGGKRYSVCFVLAVSRTKSDSECEPNSPLYPFSLCLFRKRHLCLSDIQSPPKGATIPYRPKPQVSPVIVANGQTYTIQGNYAVPTQEVRTPKRHVTNMWPTNLPCCFSCHVPKHSKNPPLKYPPPPPKKR